MLVMFSNVIMYVLMENNFFRKEIRPTLCVASETISLHKFVLFAFNVNN